MANFDMAELALKSVCPNNAMKYDDKEMPSIMVFIPKFRLCDVLSTADTSVHPAFRVNGVEIDGFWARNPTATTTTARTHAKACTAQSPPARTTTRPGALPPAPAMLLGAMTAPWRVFGI